MVEVGRALGTLMSDQVTLELTFRVADFTLALWFGRKSKREKEEGEKEREGRRKERERRKKERKREKEERVRERRNKERKREREERKTCGLIRGRVSAHVL